MSHWSLGLSRAELERDQQAREDHRGLLSHEMFWRDHQVWLAEQGYMLRPRYRPGWTPSWEGEERAWTEHEDGMVAAHPSVIDATRLSDGETVILKRVLRTRDPHEKGIATFLSSEPAKSHPRNHSVVLHEAFDIPGTDISILVMPVLNRFTDPEFGTVGEVLECFRQIFEGLEFLHGCRIAHRDLMSTNIMMSTEMWPEPFHIMMPHMNPTFTEEVKEPRTRTSRPPKYYITDFGMSVQYSPDDPHPTETSPDGGDRTVPEFNNSTDLVEHDPFAVDIYCVGNVIKKEILDVYTGCDFLKPLVDAMREPDPKKRLTIKQVVDQYNKILRSRWWWQLRAPVYVRLHEGDAFHVLDSRSMWFFHTVRHLLTFKRALPKPSR